MNVCMLKQNTIQFDAALFVCIFRVMVKDPFHANCLPVHIGTLVELGKANGKINDKYQPYIMFSMIVWPITVRVLL